MIEEGTYKDNSDQNPSRRRSWLQMRLASLIMLLTVAAIWVQWVSMQRQIRWLEQEIPQLQQLATNLVPIDPGLCYLFKTPGSYEEESSWQIHLPKGQKRTLTLGGQWKNLDRFPKDCNDATALLLGEGMHRIEVKRIGFESGIQWIVRLNGQEVFEKKIEAKDGGPGWIGYERTCKCPCRWVKETQGVSFIEKSKTRIRSSPPSHRKSPPPTHPTPRASSCCSPRPSSSGPNGR